MRFDPMKVVVFCTQSGVWILHNVMPRTRTLFTMSTPVIINESRKYITETEETFESLN